VVNGEAADVRRTEALDNEQLTRLVARLEDGVMRTAAGIRSSMAWVAALFFGFAAWSLAHGEWGTALFIGAFGVGAVVIGVMGARNTSPARMRPVVDAVRDRPELVMSVRHSTTSGSRRIVVTHWIEVRTKDHRLFIKANDDWPVLLEALSRRCPHAALDRGPG
jgi:hypothetical protein